MSIMKKKVNELSRAERCVEQLKKNCLLKCHDYNYRCNTKCIIITGESFFSDVVLDTVRRISSIYAYTFTGVGLNLDGELEIQLDPQ